MKFGTFFNFELLTLLGVKGLSKYILVCNKTDIYLNLQTGQKPECISTMLLLSLFTYPMFDHIHQ